MFVVSYLNLRSGDIIILRIKSILVHYITFDDVSLDKKDLSHTLARLYAIEWNNLYILAWYNTLTCYIN